MGKLKRKVPPERNEWTDRELIDLAVEMDLGRARAEGHERYSEETRQYILRTHGPEKLAESDATTICETREELPPIRRLRDKWHRLGHALPKPPSEYPYALRTWGPPTPPAEEEEE